MGEIDDDGDERQAGSFVGSKLLYLAGFAACIAVTAHSYLPFSLSVSIIPRLTPNGTKNQAMTDTTDEELWLPAKGQHLILDLAGSDFKTLNDEVSLKQSTMDIINAAGMTLLGVNAYKLEPQGVSVTATLAESHLTIHTWPEHGTALIDLFTCGVSSDLQQLLPKVVAAYGGKLSESTYSIIPRGDYQPDENSMSQFRPNDIMTSNVKKELLYSDESPWQSVAVWESTSPTYPYDKTRSLYLDYEIQISLKDEPIYHESLVHPAFTASSEPPETVLIVGGGAGGALREVLKYKSVKKVIMVERDASVIEASREHLPSSSTCTGYGTSSCFDDPRVTLINSDFKAWFDEEYISVENSCRIDGEGQHKYRTFDVVIIDVFDVEKEVLEGSEQFYSKNMMQGLSCIMKPYGIMATNLGEAPRAFNESRTMFSHKLDRLRGYADLFYSSKIYDSPHIPSYKAAWSFAISFFPYADELERYNGILDEQDVYEWTQNSKGLVDFSSEPAAVDYKLSQSLHEGALLSLYSGQLQHTFQKVSSGWLHYYCHHYTNSSALCDLQNMMRYQGESEEDLFEIKPTKIGEKEQNAVYAKTDIKKGTISGFYDAATLSKISLHTYFELSGIADEFPSSSYSDIYDWYVKYGYTDGEFVYAAVSSGHGFSNHGCNKTHNFASMDSQFPELYEHDINFLTNSLPLAQLVVAERDISKGEMITNDYWDHGFDWNYNFQDWCGSAEVPTLRHPNR